MTKVDWTKWSAVAEIVSSVAILMTLVHLAIQTQQVTVQNEQLVQQTQQNTDAIRSATIQALSEQSFDFNRLIIENVDAREARRASRDGTLTPDQQELMDLLFGAALRVRQNRYVQAELGTLDADTSAEIGTGGIFRSPAFSD